MPTTKLHWILTILTLLVIGFIVAVPWVKAQDRIEHYIDEFGHPCVHREYRDGMKITGCRGFSPLPSPTTVKDACLEKMEAAMRAMEPFLNPPYGRPDWRKEFSGSTTRDQEAAEYAKQQKIYDSSRKQWELVKRECWKK